MRYIADDGKIFSNECECSAYEQGLRERANEQTKDLENLNALRNAYRAAKEEYENALSDYQRKYETVNAGYIRLEPFDLSGFVPAMFSHL